VNTLRTYTASNSGPGANDVLDAGTRKDGISDNHINDNGTVDHIATLGNHTSIAMFGHAVVGDIITVQYWRMWLNPYRTYADISIRQMTASRKLASAPLKE
jgi:hypothetical protein